MRRLRLDATVEVDAHARRGIARGDVLRGLARRVGEVARVRADALEKADAREPAVLDGPLVALREGRLAPFRDGALVRLDLLRGEAGGEDMVAHRRVQDHLERLGDGAGLRGVGDGDLADEPRVREVAPRARLARGSVGVRDAELDEAVGVGADAEAGEHRGEVGAAAPDLAAEALGDHRGAVGVLEEPGGDLALRPRRDGEALRLGGAVVVGAAAEEDVDLAAEVGGVVVRAEGVPRRGLLRLLRATRGERGVRGGDALASRPRAERGGVLALKVAHDLGRAADVAPVDLHGAAVSRGVPSREAAGELLADRGDVRRDDDEDRVSLAPLARVARGAQEERQRAHERGGEENGGVLDHGGRRSAERRPS